jgi:hypothetical protein
MLLRIGLPRQIWEDNIKMELKEVECADFNRVVENAEKW